MARDRDAILKDLSALIAEDSPYGSALRVEIGNAVHRLAVHQPTAAQATHMQSVSRELHDLQLWTKRN